LTINKILVLKSFNQSHIITKTRQSA